MTHIPKHVPHAEEFMNKTYFVLAPDIDIFAAIDEMLERGIPEAYILDEDHNLVGILTEKDCLRVLSASAYNGLRGGRVSDFMSEVKEPLSPNMDLFGVAEAFLKTNFVCLPVLKDSKVIGRISRQDVLKSIELWLTRRLSELQDEHKTLKLPSSIEDLQKMVASLKKEQVIAVMKDGKEM